MNARQIIRRTGAARLTEYTRTDRLHDTRYSFATFCFYGTCGKSNFDSSVTRRVLQAAYHFIQADTLDVLHHVIVVPVMLADTKHWHDVGVMQASRRLCLPFESSQMFLATQPLTHQHFHSNTTSQRLLDRFVHDPHAATSNFLHDAEVAYLINGLVACRGVNSRHTPFRLFVGPKLFHHCNRWKQALDLVGQLRILFRVLLHVGRFTPSASFRKFFRQKIKRVAIVIWVFTHASPPITSSRISRSLSRALT